MPCSLRAEDHPVERARPLLGTRVAVRVYGLGAMTANAAIDAAFAAVTRAHVAMSFQEPTSDVALINRAAPRTRIALDRMTIACLARAEQMAELTDGAFDPCLSGDLGDLILGDGEAVLRRRLTIDLSGIAKGFAVDAACAALSARGVEQAVVNAGGDLRVLGARAEPVALRPRHGPAAAIMLAEGAAASSDAFGAGEDHGRAVHRARGCGVTRGFATVVAADCTLADALTKVALGCPVAAARALARCGAVAHLCDGERWTHLP